MLFTFLEVLARWARYCCDHGIRRAMRRRYENRRHLRKSSAGTGILWAGFGWFCSFCSVFGNRDLPLRLYGKLNGPAADLSPSQCRAKRPQRYFFVVGILFDPETPDRTASFLHADGEHYFRTVSCLLRASPRTSDLLFRPRRDQIYRRRPDPPDIFHDPDHAHVPGGSRCTFRRNDAPPRPKRPL